MFVTPKKMTPREQWDVQSYWTCSHCQQAREILIKDAEIRAHTYSLDLAKMTNKSSRESIACSSSSILSSHYHDPDIKFYTKIIKFLLY